MDRDTFAAALAEALADLDEWPRFGRKWDLVMGAAKAYLEWLNETCPTCGEKVNADAVR